MVKYNCVMADNIKEFNNIVKEGEISYDDVVYSCKFGDQQVIDALIIAWESIDNNVGEIIYNQDNTKNLKLINKFNFPSGNLDFDDIDFYSELTHRVQMYYTRKLDIVISEDHKRDECFATLKKGDDVTTCDCGKDISEINNKIQNIFHKL